MFDIKVIHTVLAQLEEERGIPKAKTLEAIELALATAYKKEYGKRGQIIRATFDLNTGKTDFFQVKVVVDKSTVILEDEENVAEDDERVRFNPEHHILIDDARMMRKGVAIEDEMIFPLESKEDFGRIAAQTAKQVIIQKIREAEKVSVFGDFGEKEGTIVTGMVQRMERGNIFFDMGRASGILPYEEQIPGERYKQGEKVRAYLTKVEETPRGVFLRLSRAHPKFLEKLFENEVPEMFEGTVSIRAIAREAGSRSKIAVYSGAIDPIGAMVGQRGVRVSTVMSELGGEKIDIIEWSEDPVLFVADALSPAKTENIVIDAVNNTATVEVAEDKLSLAIGKSGQNVRLAAKLTGYKIDIKPLKHAGSPTEEIEGAKVVAETVAPAPAVEEVKESPAVTEEETVQEEEKKLDD